MTTDQLEEALAIEKAKTDSFCVRICVATVCCAPILYIIGKFFSSAFGFTFTVNEDILFKGAGIGIISVISFRFGSPILQKLGLAPTAPPSNGNGTNK